MLLFAVLLPFPTIPLSIPTMMLFDPSLLGLFGLAAYSSLNDSIWSLGFLLHYLWAPVSHLFSSWASLAHLLSLGILGSFYNSAFSWAFTNFFELPWPNYLILHHWGSWAFHQPFTFFTCITSGLLWPIFTFLHHILPMGLLLLSLRAPLGPFAFSMPVCIFYGPRSVILVTWV